MSPEEASRRARDLWARLPTARIGPQLEPHVRFHVDLVRKTLAASPPPAPTYCLALNPTWEREGTDAYALGLQTDREELLAENDQIGTWNAGLFNVYTDAVQPIPADEPQTRAQLAEVGVGCFDYWLFCEVARRLNDLSAAPARATPDFVFFCFDQEHSLDFQLGLAGSG